MKLDTREVALQLVKEGHWVDSSVAEGERPRRVLILDDIKTGRDQLIREMKRLMPSLTFEFDVGKAGDAMVEVDKEELALRQRLLHEAADKAAARESLLQSRAEDSSPRTR
jgi:hypothetical protein